MIRHIARREVLVRSRDRSTLVSTGITITILAAIILLPSLFGGSSMPTLATADRAVQDFSAGLDVQVTGNEAEAAALVRDDEVDAALVGDRILLSPSAPGETQTLVQNAARQLRAGEADPPPLAVESVDSDADEKQAFAIVALIVLYGQLIGYGFWVSMGVVEEKSSRIVEILLAVVRPRDLLFGKVLGVGIVGLGQLLVIALAGLGIGVASGEIELGGSELSTLPIVLAWFLLGYALYAGAFALAGSLVSRQEDVQSVTTPMLMILVLTFFLGFQAVDDPDGQLAKVLSIVPLSAPLIMPVRMIAGDVAVLEILLAAGLILAATYLVIAFAARLYGSAVLQTGGRVKLRRLTSAQRGAP